MSLQSTQQTAIFLNGELTSTDARTVAEFLLSLGFAEDQVATAVNGEFVPRHARGATLLAPDDRIEVVAPRQGG
jgi:sulfur carrier protein